MDFKVSSEFDNLSLDTSDDENETATKAWRNLIKNLSEDDLEKLKCLFKSKLSNDNTELGLNRTQFFNAVCSLYASSEYALQSLVLFDSISKDERETILWNDFLDFLTQNMYPKLDVKLTLKVSSIDTVSHGKNESIAKITLIETKKYFCYAIVLKHGRVGLYDGNLNFLTSYHAILTREDISRPEDERRRRNRCITDAIFCSDILMFIIVNSARSIVIYEASGLKHVPYWLILSTPNIIQCVSYKSFKESENSQSILFSGDNDGEVMTITFLQPKNGLLKRKRTDDITIFYWEEFLNQKDHVQVHQYQNSIKNIEYYPEIDSLVTCSRYTDRPVIIKHVGNKKKSSVFKMNRGASCFALSVPLKILITGSDDGVLRLWNPVLPSKPIAVLCEHRSDVVDIQILESQELFLSCSRDGILKLWDLKEQTCLQTIRLKFPAFKIQGKLIEWGTKCIYPGPKRKSPDNKELKDGDLTSCFGIQDVTEMKKDKETVRRKSNLEIWERSNILISCCDSIAKLRMDFNDPTIEYNFCYPILSSPPLQSSVLIPSDWRFKEETEEQNEDVMTDSQEYDLKIKEEVEKLDFILKKDLLAERRSKSNINYKIAVLESKTTKMMEKVSQGAPYLALDIYPITELKLSEYIPHPKKKNNEQIFLKIKSLLDDAASRNQIFSNPSSSRSKSSSRSSLVELPL